MPKRTKQQNRAIHQYFRMRAQGLADKRYTVDELSGEVAVPASPKMIENKLWRPLNPDEEITDIHKKLFKWQAELFTELGLDMRIVLPDGEGIDWSGDIVKNCIWRPVQISVTGKESSADLTMTEVTEVFERLEGNDERGIVGMVQIKFPKCEPLEFPHKERGEIKYPDAGDYDLESIPF